MPREKMTDKSVEAAEEILSDIKVKAKAAHEAEDVFLLGILTELLSVASPIVTRAIARKLREERSTINAAHKELRIKKREQTASTSE